MNDIDYQCAIGCAILLHAGHGAPLTLQLKFKGVAPGAMAAIQRVDETHGNPMPAYRTMGSPRYPTQAQIESLTEPHLCPCRYGAG